MARPSMDRTVGRWLVLCVPAAIPRVAAPVQRNAQFARRPLRTQCIVGCTEAPVRGL